MKKVKNFILDKLPVIGFILFIYGLGYVVVGQDQDILRYTILGSLSAIFGFFLFVYGNMIAED